MASPWGARQGVSTECISVLSTDLALHTHPANISHTLIPPVQPLAMWLLPKAVEYPVPGMGKAKLLAESRQGSVPRLSGCAGLAEAGVGVGVGTGAVSPGRADTSSASANSVTHKNVKVRSM